jgi:transglutaminase-like putative cysteine protease
MDRSGLPDMRFAITHTTRYRYDAPVFLDPHAIRLRPREDAAQHVEDYEFTVTPEPAGMSECLDAEGNRVVRAWFNGLRESLTLMSRFRVETLRTDPFHYLLTPADSRLPVEYSAARRGLLVPALRAGESRAVRDLAQSIAAANGWQTLSFLNALNQRVFDSTRQVVRPVGPPMAPEVTLESGEGSCRDMAVLFMAACRAVGVAARFVSGYERGAALALDPGEQSPGTSGEMHAWAEVYLEGAGWRGYDPARALVVADEHVAVAASADPMLAAPLDGFYRGSVASNMDFEIAMQELPAPGVRGS